MTNAENVYSNSVRTIFHDKIFLRTQFLLLPRIGFEISDISFQVRGEIERYEIQYGTVGAALNDSVFNDGADIICSRQPMEPESRYTLREVIVYLVTVYLRNT